MKYACTPTRRLIIGFGIFYLILLIAAVAATGFKYRDYYIPPALDRALGENEVLRIWNNSYEARYKDYRQFVGIVSVGLGLYLTLWAAAVGVSERSLIKGLGALFAGSFVTILALSILPWIYFPLDQYPVAALWVIGVSPWIALSWLVLTVTGRLVQQRLDHRPTSA